MPNPAQPCRIRHVPSGLYYQPARLVAVQLPADVFTDQLGRVQQRTRWVKSNLGKRGKTYWLKQTQVPGWLAHSYYTHLVSSVTQLNAQGQCLLPVQVTDWQLEPVIAS